MLHVQRRDAVTGAQESTRKAGQNTKNMWRVCMRVWGTEERIQVASEALILTGTHAYA
jgi:hypothetical protein